MSALGKFVVTYLSYIVLFAVTTCIPIIATAGKVPVAQMKRVIGIVEVPPIFGVVDQQGPPGSHLPFSSAPVSVYSQPASGSRVITIIKTSKNIASAEYGYEQRGALVYDKKGGWYQIGIDNISGLSTAWLQLADSGRFHSLADLFKKGPSYLTRSWDLRLAHLPEAQAIQYDVKAGDIRVIDTRMIKHQIWLHIELLHAGVCISSSPKVVVRGWLPAFTPDGKMNVWFYSRGC